MLIISHLQFCICSCGSSHINYTNFTLDQLTLLSFEIPYVSHGLPRWFSVIESACQCRGLRFNPWKIPWRRKWQPISAFLPGEFHGQRSLVKYNPWGHKRWDMTWWLNNSNISCATPTVSNVSDVCILSFHTLRGKGYFFFGSHVPYNAWPELAHSRHSLNICCNTITLSSNCYVWMGLSVWSTKKSLAASHRDRIIFSSEHNFGSLIGGAFFSPDKDLSTLGAFFQLMLMAGFPKNTANKKDKRQRQHPKLLLLKSNLQLILVLLISNIQRYYLNISPTSTSKVLKPGAHWASPSSLAQDNVQHTPHTSPLLPPSIPSPAALCPSSIFMRGKGRVVAIMALFSVSTEYAPLSFTVSLYSFFYLQPKSYFCVILS